MFSMKGTQKKMLLLKNTGSDIFDEAYFKLKDRVCPISVSESDMVKEANRIVSENLISGYFNPTQSGKKTWKFSSFLLGFLIGTACALMFVLR